MKALRILIMAIAIMMTSGAMAQTVYSSSGSNCGSIRSDGSVYSKSGSSIGKINSERNHLINVIGSKIGNKIMVARGIATTDDIQFSICF